MHNTKSINRSLTLFIMLLGLSLLSFGCQEDKTPAQRSSQGSNDRPPETPPTLGPAHTIACYLSTCLETVNKTKMEVNNKDYDYPNNQKFPQESMRGQYIAPTYFVDLKQYSPGQNLAPNFTIREFMANHKGRYGVLSSLALTRMQQMRNILAKPIRVNSGYRSPGYNSKLSGAATWSRHTYGDAVDFAVAGMTPKDLAPLCKELGASFYQLYKSHIHCDWRREALDSAFYADHGHADAHTPSVDVARALGEQSNFSWLDYDNNRRLYIELPFYEDEGEILYDWKVRLPDGTLKISHKSYIDLPRDSGSYSVFVSVGGSVEVSEVIQW